jgi:hypothetical protein
MVFHGMLLLWDASAVLGTVHMCRLVVVKNAYIRNTYVAEPYNVS